MAVGAFTFWLQDERQSSALRATEFESVGLGAVSIENSVQNAAADLVFLSQQASLKYYLETGTASARDDLASDFLAFTRIKRIYDQVRYLDENGREVVRINYELSRPRVVPPGELQDKSDDYYVIDARGLNRGEVYVSPLDLNIERGKLEEPYKPVIRLAAPVFDGAGSRRGMVVVNYFGQDMLGAFSRAAYTIIDHTMLVNPGGYWLLHPDPALRWGFMFGHEDNFGRSYPLVWELVRGRDSGQAYLDAGLWTWQTVYPLVQGQKTSAGPADDRGTPPERQYFWKVVSFVTAERIAQQRQPRLTGYLGLTAGFVIFLLLGCLLLARSRLARALLQVDLARHVKELEKALAEVRTLRGILPICMYCHKIRTDQESWQRLEQYISGHTEAEFSHGICPDCEKKYFPDDGEGK
jgi:hypothetical protein